MSKKKKIKELEKSLEWYKEQYWNHMNTLSNSTSVISNAVKERLDAGIQSDINYNVSEKLGYASGLPNEYTVIEPKKVEIPVFEICSVCGEKEYDCQCETFYCDCGKCSHPELKVVCTNCGNEWD